MGLFVKALHELEAGSPRKPAGLFSRALLVRTKSAPDSTKSPIREISSGPAFAVEPTLPIESGPSLLDIESLALEIAAMPATLDSLFCAFQRITEAFALDELILYLCDRDTLQPAASVGRRAVASLLPVKAAGFPDRLEPGAAIDAQALSTLFGDAASGDAAGGDAEGKSASRPEALHGVVAKYKDLSPAALWLYSDGGAQVSLEFHAAMARLFSAVPLPSFHFARAEETIPKLAAQRIRLGVGKASAVRFDIAEHISGLDENHSMFDGGLLVSFICSALSNILGPEGVAFLIPGSRLLAVLYSRGEADPELVELQLRKSLSRALPCLASNLPRGASIALDLSQADAISTLERFASE
jgi:hypothetical protein